MNNYNLPICDVDKERRNFPGYKSQVLVDYTEVSEDGTTDTSSGAEKRNEVQ